MNSKKSKNTAISLNKQNINPNILLNLVQKSHSSPNSFLQNPKHYPKVSSFQVLNQSRQWHKRILKPSEKQKKLSQRLNKMMPYQKDQRVLTTDVYSHTTLNTTLWKYLCDKSLLNNSFSDRNLSQSLDELMGICQQVVGQNLERQNFQCPQQIIQGVISCLKKLQKQKPQ